MYGVASSSNVPVQYVQLPNQGVPQPMLSPQYFQPPMQQVQQQVPQPPQTTYVYVIQGSNQSNAPPPNIPQILSQVPQQAQPSQQGNVHVVYVQQQQQQQPTFVQSAVPHQVAMVDPMQHQLNWGPQSSAPFSIGLPVMASIEQQHQQGLLPPPPHHFPPPMYNSHLAKMKDSETSCSLSFGRPQRGAPKCDAATSMSLSGSGGHGRNISAMGSSNPQKEQAKSASKVDPALADLIERTICRHYLEGKCNRRKCRFVHLECAPPTAILADDGVTLLLPPTTTAQPEEPALSRDPFDLLFHDPALCNTSGSGLDLSHQQLAEHKCISPCGSEPDGPSLSDAET